MVSLSQRGLPKVFELQVGIDDFHLYRVHLAEREPYIHRLNHHNLYIGFFVEFDFLLDYLVFDRTGDLHEAKSVARSKLTSANLDVSKASHNREQYVVPRH